jgi:hypothetical protein
VSDERGKPGGKGEGERGKEGEEMLRAIITPYPFPLPLFGYRTNTVKVVVTRVESRQN